MKIGTMLQMARSGDVRARLTAVRDGQAAVRVAAVGAGLRTGVLDLLQLSPESTAALAERGGWADESLVEALMRVLAGLGLVRGSQGRWTLTRRGRAVLEDDVVRATYEGFSDYHVGLYGEIEQQLTGGPGRRDVLDKGDVIARLSRAMDPFVLEALGKEVEQRRPRHLLDVGCGAGSHLVHMLRAAPGASGVGIETDASAASMARATLAAARLDGRAEVVEGDVRNVLDPALGTFDLALLANVIYYLPVDERTPVLRAVAERMEPGGAVMVVTTALTDSLFSRHFDLLLRTQQGGEMELPDIDALSDQLRAAGLTPGKPRRIALGEPLTAVVATRS
jgi:SAM-dependent methyltransferase